MASFRPKGVWGMPSFSWHPGNISQRKEDQFLNMYREGEWGKREREGERGWERESGREGVRERERERERNHLWLIMFKVNFKGLPHYRL